MKQSRYVIKTEKGYMKGSLRAGIEFVDKSEARIFDKLDMMAYRSSIVADLSDFYGIKTISLEELE